MAEDIFGIVGTVQAGAFRVDEVVAEGGFAVVYRAYHGAFRSNVALKCLKIPRALAESEQKDFLEKFREEAEVLFRLSSAIPSVVRPLHVGTLAQTKGLFVPFIALEWLEGYTLDTLVSKRALEGKPPLDVVTAVKLLTPAADALARAHKFPGPGGTVAIIHRDLKPENIFVANIHGREIPKILDFGIAKVRNAAQQMVGRQSAGESPMSAFTPAYGAPEQWLPKRFGQTGPWTDVWGLAITLVEAVCGHTPIDGDLAAMMGSATDPVRRPTPRNEGVQVSDAVEAIFAQALAVDPRDRFHEIAAFWNALSEAIGLPRVVGEQGASLLPPASIAEPTGRTHMAPRAPAGAASAVPDLVIGDSKRNPAKPASRGPAPQAGPARAPSSASSSRAPNPASPLRAPSPGSSPRGQQSQQDASSLFGGATFDSFEDDGPLPALQTGATFDRGPRAEPVGLAAARSGPMRRPDSVPLARKLDLGVPLRLFAIAVAIMVGDFTYASIYGEVLHLGPARPVWIAGPIAAIGVVLLFQRLLSTADSTD